jgi:hypothetical protein
MEILEAFKVIPPKGDEVRIFYFRGRIKKAIETTNESGELVTKIHSSKIRSICVAAETLYDAITHLQEYRPDFYPNHANCRGVFFLEDRFPDCPALDSDTESCNPNLDKRICFATQ